MVDGRRQADVFITPLASQLSVNTTEESQTIGLLSIQIDKYETGKNGRTLLSKPSLDDVMRSQQYFLNQF